MPTAAKIASSSVGGSRLTRRVPYFVFQSSLIGASQMIAEIPRWPHAALQYKFQAATQPCSYNLKFGNAVVFENFTFSPSWSRVAGGAEVQRLLRPAFQRGMSGIGQRIDAALGAIEPAINIVQQDLPGVGNFGSQILDASRPAR